MKTFVGTPVRFLRGRSLSGKEFIGPNIRKEWVEGVVCGEIKRERIS